MRQIAIVLSAAILVACAKKDAEPAADTTATSMDQPSTLNLADMAGNWRVEVAGENNDSTLVTYEMTATADTSGWTLTFPGRAPMPIRVISVAGDSVVSEVGPYESALRPGVQVSTWSVMRLRGDRLMGHTTARYAVGTADSVVQLRSRGQRVP